MWTRTTAHHLTRTQTYTLAMKTVLALLSAAVIAASAAAHPQLDFFDLVPIMMVNQTAALTMPLSKRQECTNNWKQCDGVGCIPPDSVCCNGASPSLLS
jgi:hypothetical protein